MTRAAAALVFAGGRGSRLGGRDKAELTLAGERLVDRAVQAARRVGAEPIVILGPENVVPAGCISAREDPPFGGPLAALAAGVAALAAAREESPSPNRDREGEATRGRRASLVADEQVAPATAQLPPDAPGLRERVAPEWVLLLSCDLVDPEAAVARLAGEPAEAGEDAVVLRDPGGRAQWLAGRYRLAPLERALQALGGAVEGGALRAALSGLTIRFVDVSAAVVADIDTPADLERARVAFQDPAPGSEPEYKRAADPDPGRRAVATPAANQATRTQRAVPSAPAPASEEERMTQNRHLPPEALDEWLVAAANELGLDPELVRIATVLNVARDVAHDVARPAAPLSTFLLGAAYERALAEGAAPEALDHLAGRLTALAAAWPSASA